MAFLDATLNVGADAMAAVSGWLSLHTTGAVTSSANESTAARVAASWTTAVNGDITVTSKSFTGGAASGPCVRVGYWSAATAGTYRGGSLLTGDQTFNAAGEYTVTGITENGSAV